MIGAGTCGDQTVRFTRHAVDRLLDMAVPPEQITACLAPEARTSPSKSHPGFTLRDAGDLALSTRTEDGVLVVVTALWTSPEAWEADYQNPMPKGRAPRPRSGHYRRSLTAA